MPIFHGEYPTFRHDVPEAQSGDVVVARDRCRSSSRKTLTNPHGLRWRSCARWSGIVRAAAENEHAFLVSTSRLPIMVDGEDLDNLVRAAPARAVQSTCSAVPPGASILSVLDSLLARMLHVVLDVPVVHVGRHGGDGRL
jgi:hypothetical protein